MKKYIQVSQLASFLSAFAAIYCISANKNSMYDCIFILPLMYAIVNYIFFLALMNKKNYGVGLVFVISQVLIFVRYVLTPFFTVFSAQFTHWGWGPDPSEEVMFIAIILMSLEMCSIFVIQYYAIIKFSSRKYNVKIHKLDNYKEKYGLLICYAIFSGVLVLLWQPNLLLKEEYFVYSAMQNTEGTIALQGMFVILADTFKKVFLIIALIICKKGYDKKKNKVFLYLAVLAVAVNMALNTSETRLRMIFALILGIYFLQYIFGKIPKAFYIMGLILCIVSFISVSTTKFSYALGSSENPIRSVIAIMMGQFQDYFAGPRLVGQMIDVNKVFGNSIGISTFINDFIGSVPSLSNFVDQTNRINYYFNIYCNMSNQTLISPILGAGYCYFPVFPFFFTMFFEYCVIKLDFCMRATECLTYKYLYAYMGYVCAMCMGYSTQNLYAQFVSAFIPLLILFKMNDKLKFQIHSSNYHFQKLNETYE